MKIFRDGLGVGGMGLMFNGSAISVPVSDTPVSARVGRNHFVDISNNGGLNRVSRIYAVFNNISGNFNGMLYGTRQF